MSATMTKLKVMTVIGTRPEIIRLAATMQLLDRCTDHVLVHTGQNYDYELNEIFFEDLGLRRPNYFLQADTSSLGAVLGSILVKVEDVIKQERPDAMLVLGDTNSSIAALMARRMKVPVYHMEAGNRCFDENVPEEVNRKMIDHVADYNLVYTEHARRNLLAEGIHPSRIMHTGSPMREILATSIEAIDASDVLERQGLTAGEYLLVSLHREENVDNTVRLSSALRALDDLSKMLELPVLMSTHPRTRARLESQPTELKQRIVFHEPFGFVDYVKLQKCARLVLSDSGTISEEASILGFAAITLRDSIERPESIDGGNIITAGIDSRSVLEAAAAVLATSSGEVPAPADYQVEDTARRVLYFLLSTARTHHDRTGMR